MPGRGRWGGEGRRAAAGREGGDLRIPGNLGDPRSVGYYLTARKGKCSSRNENSSLPSIPPARRKILEAAGGPRELTEAKKETVARKSCVFTPRWVASVNSPLSTDPPNANTEHVANIRYGETAA